MDGKIVTDKVSDPATYFLLDTNILLTYLLVNELLRNGRCMITSDVRRELIKLFGEIPDNLYDSLHIDVIDTKRKDIVEEGNWILTHSPDNLIVAAAKIVKAAIVTLDNAMIRTANSEGIQAFPPYQLHKQRQHSLGKVGE